MGRSSRPYHYRPNTSDYQTIIFKSSQKLHMPPHPPSLVPRLRRPLTGSTGSLAPCADPWARASAGAASGGRPGNRHRAASSPLSVRRRSRRSVAGSAAPLGRPARGACVHARRAAAHPHAIYPKLE